MIVTACQLDLTIGDFAGNCSKIREASKLSHLHGAQLTVTPELSIWGYPPRDLTLYPGLVKESWEHIRKLANEVADHPPLLVGAVDFCKNPYTPPFLNVAVLIQNGEAEVVSSKKYLPYYDIFDEPRYFSPGSGPSMVEISGQDVIVSVCEDLWRGLDTDLSKVSSQLPDDFYFPTASYIINMSASPFYIEKQRRREERLIELADASGKKILFVNQVGGNDGVIFDGSGRLVAPGLGVVHRQPSFAEDVVVMDASLGKPQKTGSTKVEESSDMEDMRLALIMGVKDYVAKCGFKKVVLGLSGGIDSAVVACIAVQALGADNVVCAVMPSEFNSARSASDADELASNLGIKTISLPIDNLRMAYGLELSPHFQGMPPDLTEENLQSRIRGTLLMALSNKHGWLLLTTGNKSELAVGYCTIYGDMNGALGVIGDVWKTDVYKLASHINNLYPTIPQSIIDKPPSAELRYDQKDQDSLPEYDLLDDILKQLIEKFKTTSEIIDDGYKPEDVNRIARLISVSEFKRHQAPPILKLSQRCLSLGWRMPIAAHKF